MTDIPALLRTIHLMTYLEAREFCDFLYDAIAEDNSMEWRTKEGFCDHIMTSVAQAMLKAREE